MREGGQKIHGIGTKESAFYAIELVKKKTAFERKKMRTISVCEILVTTAIVGNV
jgi:hypothetical protein